MSTVTESEQGHCFPTSMSASLSGQWSSLFGSFTEKNASWHKLKQAEAPSTAQADPDHSTTSHLSAAMHQSAAFAALFDDMISSQSYSAYLQQPAVATTHSSAASLCDSATSFSFQTAQHDRTQRGSFSTTGTKPAAALVDMSALSQPREGGIGHSQEPDLAVTLKDWQVSRGCADIAGQNLGHQAASLSAEQEETSAGLKLLTTSIGGQKPSGVSARRRLNMDSADGHESSQTLQPVASPAAARAKQASRQSRRAAKERQCAPPKGTSIHCINAGSLTATMSIAFNDVRRKSIVCWSFPANYFSSPAALLARLRQGIHHALCMHKDDVTVW